MNLPTTFLNHRKTQQTTDIFRQINDNDFVYVSN